jgi:hypothetical protein
MPGRWSSYRSTGSGKFVNKKEWIRNGTAFMVNRITEEGPEGRFGEQWLLHVTEVDGDGEEKILSFSMGSEGRDEAISGAKDDLDSGKETAIGPLILVQVTTKSGRPFTTIEDADDDANAPFGVPADGGTEFRRDAGAIDDDLPF